MDRSSPLAARDGGSFKAAFIQNNDVGPWSQQNGGLTQAWVAHPDNTQRQDPDSAVRPAGRGGFRERLRAVKITTGRVVQQANSWTR